MGSLTLTDNSYIDFTAAIGNGTLHFDVSDVSGWTSDKVIYVRNYDSNDYLYFGNSASGLGSGGPYYSQILFVSPNGDGQTWPGMILPDGRVVPIPEPATVAVAALLIGALAYRERRRMIALISPSRQD
jgi:hypothetical protein